MDWFKHKTCSHEDPDISDAWDIFGDAGPVVFWTILEVFGKEFSHLKNGWLNLSLPYFERKMRRKWKKIEKILEFFEKRERIYFNKTDLAIDITIPKFIEISSNWTTRPKQTPTEVPTEVPTEAPTAIEEEEKKNKNKEEKKNKNNCQCPHQKIIDLYHQTLKSNPKIREWTPARQQLLRSRWNESQDRQNIDWWNNFFNHIAKSNFLTGRTDNPFTPGLDWILKQGNFVKIIEGNYDNKGYEANKSTVVPLKPKNPDEAWEMEEKKMKERGEL